MGGAAFGGDRVDHGAAVAEGGGKGLGLIDPIKPGADCVAGLDPRQAIRWSAAANQLASWPVMAWVLTGIGNLRFRVSQTLPRPPEEQVQITDLIGECRKLGLSRRAYAALRGVRMRAVRKAIATGQIATEADGTIEAAKAEAIWDASTDPAKQRDAHARNLG